MMKNMDWYKRRLLYVKLGAVGLSLLVAVSVYLIIAL
jgi:hypothetical protein